MRLRPPGGGGGPPRARPDTLTVDGCGRERRTRSKRWRVARDCRGLWTAWGERIAGLGSRVPVIVIVHSCIVV
jgi:hypothetical protein